MSAPDPIVDAFRQLAKSLEAEAKASRVTALSKSGLAGMMDAAEATAIFKVAQHIWTTAQVIEAKRRRIPNSHPPLRRERTRI